MSRYATATELDVRRGCVVAAADSNDYDLLGYLKARSGADDGREVTR